MSVKSDKRQNPYTRRNTIQSRVDNKELQEIFTKARLYSNGNISEYVRLAALNYRPINRKELK